MQFRYVFFFFQLYGRFISATVFFFFFFQAEDGIRDAQESRGLGDVYKRQVSTQSTGVVAMASWTTLVWPLMVLGLGRSSPVDTLGFDLLGHEQECAMMTEVHGGGLLPTWADPESCCAWGSVVMCDRDGVSTYTRNDFHHGGTTGHLDHHKAVEGFPSTVLGDCIEPGGIHQGQGQGGVWLGLGLGLETHPRTCVTFTNTRYKLTEAMNVTGLDWGGDASWADCLTACQDQIGCAQVIWNQNRSCFPMAGSTEERDPVEQGWLSAHCSGHRTTSPEVYKSMNSSNCNQGHYMVGSLTECEAAAAAVGLQDRNATAVNNASLPPGCWSKAETLHWNSDQQGQASGGEMRAICRAAPICTGPVSYTHLTLPTKRIV
eukprot:TRINITY_DN5913_c0_g1_i9.p1 TRINITY_DN5913_c0_g1~~TRINITY_DN5913_c0_g1_i9.p1  ORF type:complete len:375 (-),score=83.92 TRINITY_DN5913_c0_g1_i9:149-1273(-)